MKLEKFRASPELEAWLLKQGGPHYVCDNGSCSLDTLEGLQRFRAIHGDGFENAALPVFPYAEDSIFSREADAAYQAYHDRCHALYDFQFDMAGEYRLACYHRSHALRDGLCQRDADTLYHFVASRVEFMYRHNDNNPPCRATFVDACFKLGGRVAARGDYLLQYWDLHS